MSNYTWDPKETVPFGPLVRACDLPFGPATMEEDVLGFIHKLKAENKALKAELEEEKAKLNDDDCEKCENCGNIPMTELEKLKISYTVTMNSYELFIEKLKKERDFFNEEFHKTLQHQADDSEQYEKEIKSLKEEIKRQINNYRATANDIKCLVGVCKGETYPEAKKHIMKEQSIEYWREWRKRVTWGVID